MIPGPLRGGTVIELSRFISGSVAGQFLADDGAVVEKLEPPRGDPSRAFGRTEHGSTYFRTYNTGKRCRELDLADPAARERLDASLASADALITNPSPRALRRHGLDWASLQERHHHLSLGAVTGYGLADDRSCFDAVAQTDGGYASLNAWEDGTPHVAAGYPVDVIDGLQLGTAVAMTLLSRPSVGVLVDVATVDVAASRLGGAHGIEAVERGTTPRGEGNRDRASAPAAMYRCLDGHVYVYAGADHHCARFAEFAELPDLNPEDRVANGDRLDSYVRAWTGKRTVEAVCWELEGRGIPVGAVRDLPEAVERLETVRPGSVATVTTTGEALPSHPALFGGSRVPRRPAPAVAQEAR